MLSSGPDRGPSSTTGEELLLSEKLQIRRGDDPFNSEYFDDGAYSKLVNSRPKQEDRSGRETRKGQNITWFEIEYG